MAQARAYNDWCSDHTQEGEGRLFGAGALPPMHDARDMSRVVADEIRDVAELPGMVSVFMRPNPAVEWQHFNDPVYDPIWQAAADTGLPIAFHPFLAPTSRCVRGFDWPGPVSRRELRAEELSGLTGSPGSLRRTLFTQAIANPVDVMSSICYITAGGVCERFPEAKFIFLEANGGWLVPVARAPRPPLPQVPVGGHRTCKLLPSEYFRRQCWISFDPDESMLASPPSSPLVGADRIIWASATTRTPTPSSPASPRSWPKRSRDSPASRSARSPPRAPSPSTASAESH